jgi:lipopolysaccharide transport system ATP-binding protein
MSSDIVIRAEGLGKKYTIGHQSAERVPTLRDAIARGAGGLLRGAGEMLRGRAIIAGDETEEFWALKDVNFEVARGEVLGIIGRNGAGKSTLLKVLSRITEPTEGRVEIRGRVASLLEVGTGFHPELSGRENIFLNGAILGMSRREIKAKFDEIVDFAEVERFLDTPVKRYSSGMYVRLAFAVAAHLEPEILVGDAEFQKKCLGKMQDVASRGRTVLFVSHNMGAISALCQKALYLRFGQIEEMGPCQEVVERYSRQGELMGGSVEFSPRNGAAITSVTVDPDCAIRGDLEVSIAFSSPHPILRPIGGLIVKSSLGEPVWGSNGIYHPAITDERSHRAESGVIRCSVKGLPVIPGEYRLSAWLSDWLHVLDSRQDCISVQIGMDKGAAVRPPAHMTGYLDWHGAWNMDDL